jgi:hypothetical protein
VAAGSLSDFLAIQMPAGDSNSYDISARNDCKELHQMVMMGTVTSIILFGMQIDKRAVLKQRPFVTN